MEFIQEPKELGFTLEPPVVFYRIFIPYAILSTESSKQRSISELHARAKRAWAEPHSWGNLLIPENLVITWPTDCPSAPQVYQCLLSHFLATLGDQEEADCTSMLSSIDSCQNRVSADEYHLTVSRAQLSSHQGRVFCWSYPPTIYWFSNGCRLTLYFFLKFIWNMLCLCQYRPAVLRFWFQTDLRRKKSASFLKIQAGKTFCYHGHMLGTFHVQFLCCDWLKFDHA